jgi:phosphatidylinositol alpha-1,6-mannosyltransferase
MDRRDIFIRDWGIENPGRLLRYWRMNRAVKQRLKQHKRVMVHAIHAVPEVAALVPLKKMYGDRLRIVTYAHGEEVTACDSSRQLRLMMHAAYRASDIVIANSRYTTGVLKGHVDDAKVHVVNPGVEFEGFAPAAQLGVKWRHEQGYDDRFIVVTVGRLDPRKNHIAIIEAVAALRQRYPNLLYVAAGEGRAMTQWKDRAKALGLDDYVLFPGLVDGQTKLSLYGACDVFAMPAIRDGTDVEGFGMVFLEAGACGKASLAGKEGGQAEAVKHGETGLVVDGTDQAAVNAALVTLLDDDNLRHRLGDQAKAWAKSFDWPRVVDRTVKLVEERL